MKLYRFFCSFVLVALTSCAEANADIKITDAWTRATAPGQEIGAAYLTLQSVTNTNLVKVESSAAGSIEIHSMTMEKGVMKMRMLGSLPLTAGKPIKLEPGGFHLMLFDLKKPLKAGESISFTLHFKDSTGKTSTMLLSTPIKENNH